jgi:4a-hydroxytetrahydrobiopterin dehydratase
MPRNAVTHVTLYTRRDCPLCEKAKRAIRDSGVSIHLEEVDIDRDPALQARYTDDVPVIVVGGVEAFRHRVDPQAFAAYIRGRREPMTTSLANEKCIPCRGGVPPLEGAELRSLAEELGNGWSVVEGHHLEKTFKFPDFAQALAFTNRVGAVAEEEGHHPDIYLTWGSVRITIWTHKIDGLTRSDFILAAKIDKA